MRKILLLGLMTVLVAGAWLGVYPSPVQAADPYSFTAGDGSPGNPYVVMTAEDMDHVRDDLDASYKLGADIDLSVYATGEGWTPIGTSSEPFTGDFDGNEYLITHLFIDSANDMAGLFGYLLDATISDVRLTDVEVKGPRKVGGLVGQAARTRIVDCSATGSIQATIGFDGGLVGYLSGPGAAILNSYSAAQVTGPNYAGGLVGLIDYGADGIESSYSSGIVNGVTLVGGLIGENEGPIRNSYSTGEVSASTANGIAGGLVAYMSGDVQQSFQTGTVTGKPDGSGALVGYRNTGTLADTFYNMTDNPSLPAVSHGDPGAGYLGLSESAMRTKAAYGSSLDFSNIWGINEGKSYPYLRAFTPIVRVNALDQATYGLNSSLKMNGFLIDGSMGEEVWVDYEVLNHSNLPVANGSQNFSAATGDRQSYSFSETLDSARFPEGTYTVNVTAEDHEGHVAPTRSVAFTVDHTPPGLTLNGASTVDVAWGGTYSDLGATASDAVDGDVTSNITVSGTVDTNTLGSYTLTYTVKDAAGNQTTATRTVNVVDSDGPVLTLKGDNPMQIDVGSVFADPGATATDAVDGDVTSKITVSGTVDTTKVGSYTLTYTVEDAAGNQATATRTVNAVDPDGPVLTLKGDNPMQITVGSAFKDPGATATDAVDGDVTSKITVSGTVDTNTIGSYTLTYHVQDSSGNAAKDAVRTVNVVSSGGSSGGGSPVVTRSSNANLAQITFRIDGSTQELAPVFTPETTEYTLETDADRVELEIAAADSKATVQVQDAAVADRVSLSLAIGTQEIKIAVQAEDGTRKVYMIKITRHDEQESPSPNDECAFTDVRGHWAEADICEAAGLKIVEGVSATLFAPNQTVTRAEFAVMLLRTLEIPIVPQSAANPFSDKETIPEWAREAIHTGAVEGVLDGYPDGTFLPWRTISRSEMAAMLAKALKLKTDQEPDAAFSDHASIPVWAKPYVEAVHAKGLLQGRGVNQFDPDGVTTRAEAAAAMLRLWHSQHES